MNVEVLLHPRGAGRTLELPHTARGLDLLRALDLALDAHLLLRGDLPIPEDEPLREGDNIRVIAVVSGG